MYHSNNYLHLIYVEATFGSIAIQSNNDHARF